MFWTRIKYFWTYCTRISNPIGFSHICSWYAASYTISLVGLGISKEQPGTRAKNVTIIIIFLLKDCFVFIFQQTLWLYFILSERLLRPLILQSPIICFATTHFKPFSITVKIWFQFLLLLLVLNKFLTLVVVSKVKYGNIFATS